MGIRSFLADKLKSQPAEVQLLQGSLENIARAYPYNDFWDRTVVDVSTKTVIQGIREDSKFATDTIKNGGWAVQDAALMILSEFAATALLSGELHVYRGVVNDQGKAYTRLYKFCVGKLMASKRLSEKEAVEQVQEVLDGVAAIG
ncbi:hypothetical protein [Brucella pseudogrignonensis]|uniref:hypothetical protein n=1 Tax=Brucella pseudogrignonensis TaxID=419475 RepID=UPI000A05739B|nr:hypothetical protein [Brucella pseudogrignonensis]